MIFTLYHLFLVLVLGFCLGGFATYLIYKKEIDLAILETRSYWGWVNPEFAEILQQAKPSETLHDIMERYASK